MKLRCYKYWVKYIKEC